MARVLALVMIVGMLTLGCDSNGSTDGGAADTGVDFDGGATLDAGTFDAGTALDGGPTIDAGPTDAGPTDAGPTDAGPDSGTGCPPGMICLDGGPMVDGGPMLDAGTSDGGRVRTPGEICTSTCDRLLSCGFGGPTERAECIRDCTTDLGDCSEADLNAADACHSTPDACEVTIVDGPPKMIECLMRISCVMG